MHNRSLRSSVMLSLLFTGASSLLCSQAQAQMVPMAEFEISTQEASSPGEKPTGANPSAANSGQNAGPNTGSNSGRPNKGKKPGKSFDAITKDLEKQDGFITLYRDREKNKLLAAIRPEQLNRYYLMVTTISSGVGEFGLYRGMPLQDFPLTLRKIEDKLQVVVPNLYFRSHTDDPLKPILKESFSDSVLYALPIVATEKDETGTAEQFLVDVSDLFLGEAIAMNTLGPVLQNLGYRPEPEEFALKRLNNLDENLELDATYEFKGGKANSFQSLSSLPNSSALTLGVHYSFSELPWNNGYRPRAADERIGYFVTAYRNVAAREQADPFVRNINRWFLEKSDPSAERSKPKQPIVLWIENTVPEEYRQAFREGALMWNQAFEKIGFEDAIEVRQMPDDADWDPADVRYNTIRWVEGLDIGFALGPSRVNPFNGQILDGDILIGSGLVRYARLEYETLGRSSRDAQTTAMAELLAPMSPLSQAIGKRLAQQPNAPQALRQAPECMGLGDLQTIRESISQGLTPPQLTTVWAAGHHGLGRHRLDHHGFGHRDRCFAAQATQQYAYGALALSSLRQVLPSSHESREYINQYLKSLVAHEVGHLLGLRHNFQGSDWLSPDELHDPSITRSRGMVASIMDYVPVNLAPPGVTQGDYFPQVIGPYDEWAIEYGYRPVENSQSNNSSNNSSDRPSDRPSNRPPSRPSPAAEQRMLEAIARRAAEPGLAYATDEDAVGLDPRVHRFDLSNDLISYNATQLQQTRVLWEKLNLRGPGAGSSYSDLRQEFTILLDTYIKNVIVLNDYIGGQQFNRYRAGDAPGQLPLSPVPIAQQRRALQVLSENVFDAEALTLPPQLLNKLPPARWYHWGQFPSRNLEYPFYDQVSLFQTFILSDLLSGDRLARLRDAELRSSEEETLTIDELFSSLHQSIWSKPLQQGELSPLQRGLQRKHLEILSNMTLRNTRAADQATSMAGWVSAMMTLDAPEDARALARLQLKQLQKELQRSARQSRDRTTRAHCEDIAQRIETVLTAQRLGN